MGLLKIDYQSPESGPRRSVMNRIPRWLIYGPLALLIILALSVAALVPQIGNGGRHPMTKSSAAFFDISNLQVAVQAFHDDVGRYPTTAEGLSALVSAPPGATGWKHFYIDGIPSDPWGNEYLYAQPGTGSKPFDIISRGSDGVQGTSDDITN
jgi:general secretion pathway protein G